ncbi:hypothetical protein [Sulfurovum sp.]|uniref:hypothetical protein n=1 Tax=Sulfurovum sp. TaxID=1969726 RepID=UPI00356B47E8
MRAKNFVLLAIGLVPVFFTAYLLLFLFQLNASVGADYWVNDAYTYKDYRAKGMSSKKIIIIGGSNALFGINSEIIEKLTGYPVLNLATHAGLNMDYFCYKLEQYVGQEDIVVMPLEFSFYTTGENITDLFSNNMMSWGRDYLLQLPFTDFLKFVLVAEPDRVLAGVIKQVETKGVNYNLLTQKEIVNTLQKIWSTGDGKWRGYSYKSLNRFGDVNVALPLEYHKDSAYFKQGQEISSHFLKVYAKIEKLVRVNNGKLYLTYPVTMKNEKFDLGEMESRVRVKNLEKSLDAFDIKMYCNPALFNLDVEYFYNTNYHPNKYGALVRSENLAICLNRLEDTGDKREMSFKEAIERTTKLQKKYTNQLNKL